MSYDARQLDKPLRLCLKCGRAYYMTDVICAWCGEGYRTVQNPPPDRRDVNGVVMSDP